METWEERMDRENQEKKDRRLAIQGYAVQIAEEFGKIDGQKWEANSETLYVVRCDDLYVFLSDKNDRLTCSQGGSTVPTLQGWLNWQTYSLLADHDRIADTSIHTDRCRHSVAAAAKQFHAKIVVPCAELYPIVLERIAKIEEGIARARMIAKELVDRYGGSSLEEGEVIALYMPNVPHMRVDTSGGISFYGPAPILNAKNVVRVLDALKERDEEDAK